MYYSNLIENVYALLERNGNIIETARKIANFQKMLVTFELNIIPMNL